MASEDIESLIMTSSQFEFESRLASISQTWTNSGQLLASVLGELSTVQVACFQC